MYSIYIILTVIIALIILVFGAFRDDRIKRELTEQIDYLKNENQKAWDNTRTAEKRINQIRQALQKQVRELQEEADKLRSMIWKYIDKHRGSR